MTNLLEQVLGKNDSEFDGDDPSWAIRATQPAPMKAASAVSVGAEIETPPESDSSFTPLVPTSFREAGLTESQVESLLSKFLLNVGSSSGRDIARQICLPFGIVEKLLHQMKYDQLVVFKADAHFGDYVYELAPAGVDRARLYAQQTTYFGGAPVPLKSYIGSVNAQAVSKQALTMDQVQNALSDLVISHKTMCTFGEAMNMGKGMFLHGNPGNGKTSLAERVIRAFGSTIWIPRAISVGGEIVRLFDPIHHIEAPLSKSDPLAEKIDTRWVRILRPTISAAGELEIKDLDVSTNSVTGINEAPLQLKANCGTLVIDDFGRNRFRPEELLNRLIVPLERQVDALHLSSGRTFEVPFQSMVLFSTNLDPHSLVDEAFLRRIPFCLEITDPCEEEFCEVFRNEARRLELTFTDECLEHLLQRHYRAAGREMRFCHPRDILEHIQNGCEFHQREMRVTEDGLDNAIESLLALRHTALPQ